jgi:hypothetical protein
MAPDAASNTTSPPATATTAVSSQSRRSVRLRWRLTNWAASRRWRASRIWRSLPCASISSVVAAVISCTAARYSPLLRGYCRNSVCMPWTVARMPFTCRDSAFIAADVAAGASSVAMCCSVRQLAQSADT